MKPILVIGTTCVDTILTMDHLPVTEEDINPTSQTITIGGCAFNAANIIRQSGTPVTLASPVGSGVYGDFIAEQLTKIGFPIFHRATEENGCCYCLVESSGERTFLSYHGIEYSFRREWMKDIRIQEYGYVYICGLEVEEPTGAQLVEYLEEFLAMPSDTDHTRTQIFFCPGPRIGYIPPDRIKRILALRPILHINRRELQILSGCNTLEEGCQRLQQQTKNTVIVTLGSDGAYCLDPNGHAFYTPAFPGSVVDTIGAGDSHAGQILADLAKGRPLAEAIKNANLVSSHVVGIKGASLTDRQYQAVFSAVSHSRLP